MAVAIVPTLPDDDSLVSGHPDRHVAIVMVDGTDIVADRAMAVGRLVTEEEPRFVHFDIDREETERLMASWKRDEPELELEIEPAPIRELSDSIVSFVRHTRRGDPPLFSTIVRGEVVPPWWQRFLHADEAREAEAALLHEPGTVFIAVPYHL